jgi:hypothetical protein
VQTTFLDQFESATTRRAGGLDFSAYKRKKTKARQCLNHCVCDRVRRTRSVYKQPPGLKHPIKDRANTPKKRVCKAFFTAFHNKNQNDRIAV